MTGSISLPEAFTLGDKPEIVAFVGGGGKSSLMLALAARLSGRVLVTTTTRMFEAQIETAAASLPGIICRYPDLSALDYANANSRIFLVAGPSDGKKVSGIPLDLPYQLLGRTKIDTVLVEADGSKMLPVKAPAAHEPAVPAEATLVIPVVGIDSLGKEIRHCAHRPDLLAHLLGKTVADRLTAADLAKLLADHNGGLKNVPPLARVIPVINKVGSPEELAAARKIAHLTLQEPRFQQVVISRAVSENPVIEVHKRVTGVILAAGQSARMGRSKQLMPWGDTTILGQTIRTLKKACLYDVLVITGYDVEATATIADAEGVLTLTNLNFAEGEMLSSLQTAVAGLAPHIAAVLVMLADQPMVEAETINTILEAYWQGRGVIIAPEYAGRRGNPVLIDRRHFQELLALPVGSAPRDLLQRHEVTLVPVDSQSVLQDIDRLEDYRRYRPTNS